MKQMEPHELHSNTVDQLNLSNFLFFEASLTGLCDFLKHCKLRNRFLIAVSLNQTPAWCWLQEKISREIKRVINWIQCLPGTKSTTLDRCPLLKDLVILDKMQYY